MSHRSPCFVTYPMYAPFLPLLCSSNTGHLCSFFFLSFSCPLRRSIYFASKLLPTSPRFVRKSQLAWPPWLTDTLLCVFSFCFFSFFRSLTVPLEFLSHSTLDVNPPNLAAFLLFFFYLPLKCEVVSTPGLPLLSRFVFFPKWRIHCPLFSSFPRTSPPPLIFLVQQKLTR